jgi:hypothetical protein
MSLFRKHLIKKELSLPEENLLIAKTKQEEAIAERIRNSVEVQIEEYYDAINTEGLSMNANQNGLNTNLNASNQRISKRVYHFSGSKPDTLDTS